MDEIGFVSYLRQFHADVLLFGLAAWALALLLRRTLLKNAGAKVQALLPFALGAVLYTAYRLIVFGVCGDDAAGAFTEGLTCGSFATALHVLLNRPAGVSAKAACVQSMLSGYVTLSAEQAEELAAAVEQDEAGAKALLAVYVGDAADTYYRLLRETLQTFGKS